MTPFKLPLRIGTRRSPLARAQAEIVSGLLRTKHEILRQNGALELVFIQTTGDRVQDRPLSAIGGKGLFTKEIDLALEDGRVDIAVHSMKDVPAILPDGLIISCFLAREDPRDALISANGTTFESLPAGSLIGTTSLRRRAQILSLRPDLRIKGLRGNVDTRLKKLGDGVVDATLLAFAGLRRLGQQDIVTEVMSTEQILPAVAQGVIGLQSRQSDEQISKALIPLNDAHTEIVVRAERAFLKYLNGSCETPIAAFGTWLDDSNIVLTGLLASPNGTEVVSDKIEGSFKDADKLGSELAARLFVSSVGGSLTQR